MRRAGRRAPRPGRGAAAFQRGECERGDSCRFSHDDSGVASGGGYGGGAGAGGGYGAGMGTGFDNKPKSTSIANQGAAKKPTMVNANPYSSPQVSTKASPAIMGKGSPAITGKAVNAPTKSPYESKKSFNVNSNSKGYKFDY